MSLSRAIGIVGGVGPYAGLDLNRKIFDQTLANTDQDHLRVVLISCPVDIPDRTEYLLKKKTINPAIPIFNILESLELFGASVVGIPCNTAHAPEIFDVLVQKLRQSAKRIEILHMVEEVACFIKQYYPTVNNVGILATNGTVHSCVYTKILKPEGFNVIYPRKEVQYLKVHASIYDPTFGIKAKSNPVTATAQKTIKEAMENLIEQGAECIILGCTELSLAIETNGSNGKPIIDPTLILARALIGKVAPNKLRPLPPL